MSSLRIIIDQNKNTITIKKGVKIVFKAKSNKVIKIKRYKKTKKKKR